jgi:hypothetical protein
MWGITNDVIRANAGHPNACSLTSREAPASAFGPTVDRVVGVLRPALRPLPPGFPERRSRLPNLVPNSIELSGSSLERDAQLLTASSVVQNEPAQLSKHRNRSGLTHD